MKEIEVQEITDVVALVVPADIDLSEEARPALVAELDQRALRSVAAQYDQPPRALLVKSMEWLITNRLEDIDDFQPAHDCAACRAGNDQALAYLRDHPEQHIALGNIVYQEVW